MRGLTLGDLCLTMAFVGPFGFEVQSATMYEARNPMPCLSQVAKGHQLDEVSAPNCWHTGGGGWGQM